MDTNVIEPAIAPVDPAPPVLPVDPDSLLAAAFPDPAGPDLPALVETTLPDSFHQCYRLKLAGVPVTEIASRFGIDRTTVWRHCRAVEQEFADQLEKSPQFNILALEIKRLTDLEEQLRDKATHCKSERAAVMALAAAAKTAEMRQKLLLDTGILDREPSKMYQAILNIKQPDKRSDDESKAFDRADTISRLIEKAGKSVWPL